MYARLLVIRARHFGEHKPHDRLSLSPRMALVRAKHDSRTHQTYPLCQISRLWETMVIRTCNIVLRFTLKTFISSSYSTREVIGVFGITDGLPAKLLGACNSLHQWHVNR
jgi:hypothetical protein